MNRKTVALLVLLALIALAAAFFVKIDGRNAVLRIESDGVPAVSVRRDAYEVTSRGFYSEAEDAWIIVLPAGMDDRVIYNDALSAPAAVDGEALRPFGSFAWEEEKVYTLAFETGEGRREMKVKFETTSGIPSVFIATETGSMRSLNAAKANAEGGRILAVEPDGSVSFDGRLTLHGRGSSSFYLFDKKPFRIKLDKAGSLLGMKKDKDWVLLANAWDYSYMNNKLAFDMAGKAGLGTVPQAEYADVWFNGDYWGIYLVAETVEVDEDRTDITDLETKNRRMNPGQDPVLAEPFDTGTRRGVKLESVPEDITGGYLVERDYRLQPDYAYRSFTPSYFETKAGTGFNIRSPEYADEREVEYIAGLIENLEEAILSEEGENKPEDSKVEPEEVTGRPEDSAGETEQAANGKNWTEYIDLTSWVRCYMVAEIACDADKDITNAYYYKDTDTVDPKIYMGPVWDYDNRFGGYETYSSPELLPGISDKGWFYRLSGREEFFEAVCEEWNRFFRDYLENEAGKMIDAWQKQIEKSVSLDLLRWPRNETYPVKWPTDEGPFTENYDFEKEVSHLKTWLKTRKTVLDRLFGSRG